MSGTKPNVLAYFGMKTSSSSTSIGDFVGMVPRWNFVGGPSGLAGQYATDQIGLNSNDVNSVMESAGSGFKFDTANPASSLLFKAQLERKEYFDPNFARSTTHKHTIIVGKTAEQKIEDEGGVKSHNGNSVKRKYRALTLRNPVENYFLE